MKVPVPPVGQWVPVVQKSKSEKKPAEGTSVEVQSPKLSRTQRRRLLRKKASVKSEFQLEVESKPEIGLTVRYPAEGQAGKRDRKKLEKGQTSSAEFF